MTTRYIREFVLRIYYMLLSATTTFLCAYHYSEQMVYVMTMPLTREGTIFKLISTEISENLYTYILSSTVATLWMLHCISIYQVWQFIKPGLYRHEGRVFRNLFFLYVGLSIIGITATHFIILPSICTFFLNYEILMINHNIEIKVYTYSFFILKALLASSAFFLLSVALARTGPPRRAVYFALIFMSGFIPDIISQMVALLFVFFLHEGLRFAIKFLRHLSENIALRPLY